MKFNEFCEIFLPLCEYFGKELSEATLLIYYRALSNLCADELNRAIDEIIAKRKYSNLPKVAEILDILNPDIDQKAELALYELINAMNKYGSYYSVCFKDRAIMGVVNAIGGWEALGRLDGKDWENFKTFTFKEKYRHWAKNIHLCPFKLSGISEKQNSFHNKSNDYCKVAMIGFSPDEIYSLKLGGKKVAINGKNCINLADFNALLNNYPQVKNASTNIKALASEKRIAI